MLVKPSDAGLLQCTKVDSLTLAVEVKGADYLIPHTIIPDKGARSRHRQVTLVECGMGDQIMLVTRFLWEAGFSSALAGGVERILRWAEYDPQECEAALAE